MKQSKIFIISLLSLVSISSAYAKEGDLQQELKVAANSQKADIKNNQVIFFGPVNVTQGTININADELRAFGTESGTRKTMVATGNPATFSQELDDGRIGTASANEIKYELATSILTLKGNAKLDQAGSQVTGNLISYNIDKQQLIAESLGDGKDRVITIFQPENHPELIDEEKAEPSLPEAQPLPESTNGLEDDAIEALDGAVEENVEKAVEQGSPTVSEENNQVTADITNTAESVIESTEIETTTPSIVPTAEQNN